MSNEHEMVEVEVLTLPMDDDSEQDFAIMERFELNSNKYIALAEIIEEHVGPDRFFLIINEEAGTYESIDDEAAYEKVADHYEKNIKAK